MHFVISFFDHSYSPEYENTQSMIHSAQLKTDNNNDDDDGVEIFLFKRKTILSSYSSRILCMCTCVRATLYADVYLDKHKKHISPIV